jgi:general secretion pathway protein H
MQRRGFTVIETLAVIAIVAVVAGAGTTALGSLAATLRLATEARTLAQSMRAARARAMAEGEPIEVRFDAAASRWAIVSVPDGRMRRQEVLSLPLRFAALPLRARIRFDASGDAENGTIEMATPAASRRIVVNQRGRVRIA